MPPPHVAVPVKGPGKEISEVVPLKPMIARFDALDGLRGLVALWITLFHSFHYSEWNVSLAGSSQMPLFFILSGFVLAITDGRTRHAVMYCCQELCPPEGMNPPPMNARNFFHRRLVRIVPLFFLTNLLAAPLIWLGHGYHDAENSTLDFVLTFTGTSTWFGMPWVINGPSWFVSTLLFFYYVFPSLLPRLQAMETSSKRNWLARAFFIQMFVGIFLIIFCSEPFGGTIAFWIATAWPPSRLPVFVMGILAGLLRLQGSEECWHWYKSKEPLTANQFANLTDRSTFWCLFWLALACTADTLIPNGGIGSFWIQMIIADCQLNLAWNLTLDEGLSYTAMLLIQKPILWLGEISYALYLVHEPVLYWCIYAVRGSAIYGPYTQDEHIHELPPWMIPVHVGISILLAAGLYYFVEIPIGNWLRPARAAPKALAAPVNVGDKETPRAASTYASGYGSFPNI